MKTPSEDDPKRDENARPDDDPKPDETLVPPEEAEDGATLSIDGVVESYDLALSKSDGETLSIDLAQFLPPAGEPNRQYALFALIRRELEIRWKRGQPVKIEDYLKRFPEMGSMASISAQLIFHEYRVRHLHGDKPDLIEYRERFPIQYKALEKIVSEQPIGGADGATMTLVTPGSLASASTAPRDDQRIVPIAGGYRLIKKLGDGQFGVVWKAETATTGIEAAVKVITRSLDHESAQRELQTLEQIKNLQHPFLLQNREFGTWENRLYIIMELAESSLRDRLRLCPRGEGIPLEELLKYTRESAEALDFLHDKNLQHRDVKPENILLSKGHVKVADFGLAKVLNTEKTTTQAELGGTPPYMAPETWDNKLSKHSDLYSLAAMYVELRLNRRLFPAQSWGEWMRCHMLVEPDLKALLPAERKVLLKALAKAPKERYPSCMEFAKAVEEAVRLENTPKHTQDSQGQSTKRDTLTELIPSQRWLLVASLVCALLLLSFGVYKFVIAGPNLAKMRPDGRWEPDSYGVIVPVGFMPVAGTGTVGDLDGKTFYERIQSGESKTEFVVIPRRGSPDWTDSRAEPPTFYIMKYKVTLDLFRNFAKTNKGLITSTEWEATYDAHCPVFNITLDEACIFADNCFHGKVPMRDQWDKAAGFFRSTDQRGDGPFMKDGHHEIIVGRRQTPWPTDRENAEVSYYGCCDMAGNGLEWTSDVNKQGNNRAPLKDDPGNKAYQVYLRGKSYDDDVPFLFNVLEGDPPLGVGSKGYTERASVSFRVVLEQR